MILSLGACTDPNQPGTTEPQTNQQDTAEPTTNQPRTSFDTTGGNVTEVTQDNLFDLFIRSLQCFASCGGSYLYSISVFDGEDSNSGSWYRILEYNDIDSLKADMNKYMSYDLIEECLSFNNNLMERDGFLLIETPQRGGGYSYDITSMKLIETNGDEYTIMVDAGALPGTDEFTNIRKTYFTTKLKDGILYIESYEEGDLYTAEELREATPEEDRRWIGEYWYGTTAEAVPFIWEAIENQRQ